MSAALTPRALENLARTPASDMKKLGWRGVMETVRREGPVLVTNHDRPEAVILPIAEYERLQREAAAYHETTLETLRGKYDARLQWLKERDASDVLGSVFESPVDLDGKIFTGREF